METWNDSQRTDVFTLNEDPVSANMNNSSDVPSLNTNDEVVDMGADFDFEGFQVVRREFFAHLREPAVTFNNYKFYVNCACLNKFPDAFYVQVLVNQETKIMALRPCAENNTYRRVAKATFFHSDAVRSLRSVFAFAVRSHAPFANPHLRCFPLLHSSFCS